MLWIQATRKETTPDINLKDKLEWRSSYPLPHADLLHPPTPGENLNPPTRREYGYHKIVGLAIEYIFTFPTKRSSSLQCQRSRRHRASFHLLWETPTPYCCKLTSYYRVIKKIFEFGHVQNPPNECPCDSNETVPLHIRPNW